MKVFESFSILSIICVLFSRTIHAGFLNKRDDDQNPLQEPQILPYSTAGCGGENNNPAFVCLIQCPYDMRCQSLGWNFTIYSCACGAEICPDGKIYTSYDYTKDTPLTDAQIAKQPHVLAPCNGCVPSDVAPCHQQIGDCSTLANYTQSESGTSTCY